MKELWSLSTTARNPERISEFFEAVFEMDGVKWDSNSQMELQSRLIKKRYYKPTNKNLSEEQISLLNDIEVEMTLEQAIDIFHSN